MRHVNVTIARSVIESRYRGGLAQFLADAPAAVEAEEVDALTVAFDAAEDAEAWIDRVLQAGVEASAVRMSERMPAQRFDMLSMSDSGLYYVRERRGGTMRVLTPEELAGFSDPAPCPECAEQFGCEHFNCAGEPLLSDAEVEAEVPREWRAFAKDYGISRADLERLAAIELSDGEYRTSRRDPDMRMLELVLLLNDSR